MPSSNNSKETDTQREASEQFANNVKDQAAQIWQAGLGAFAKAQAEGTKFFENLAKEGAGLQKKTQTSAEEKITEASAKMASVANEMGARAVGQWDKLEGLFETRVSKAMAGMGAPTAADIAALNARIDELSAKIDAMGKAKVSPAKAAVPTPRKTSKKAPDVASKASAKVSRKPASKAVAKKNRSV